MKLNLLDINIVSGPVVNTIYAVAALILLYLLIRPWSRAWLRTALLTIVISGALGILTLLVVERGLKLIDAPLGAEARTWIVLAFIGFGVAIVNLFRSRWWRKVIAALGIVSFALAATVGVNAAFGINPTVGAFLHIVENKPIHLAKPTAQQPKPTGPLYQSWKPPAGMPALGRTGTQVIPGTLSGFKARPAGIYLPPAALAPNPPALPLMIMMMGQPGDPNPAFMQQALDAYAVENNGLAPIVVVADQLGNPNVDTLCINSKQFGNVETYMTQDVPNWALANLNVIKDPSTWTIAGYSNGGGCAIYYGATHPELFRNVIDISGEDYPGASEAATSLKNFFGGNMAAYDAIKPLKIMATRHYTDSTAIFTGGAKDPDYSAAAAKVAAGARAAGMNTTLFSVPGAGHGADALVGGMKMAARVLFPVLGLAPKS
ncbi:alpha/beta hydrolase [Mycetocola lacteus]|uniref:alpha/beta hydrolase n=1 Tax=Mycetocola lacteus TaxID=76637 RepID=UPI001FE35348|nr:alpha/beta hydrolase-fold protein [Mycetocola lacteus]